MNFLTHYFNQSCDSERCLCIFTLQENIFNYKIILTKIFVTRGGRTFSSVLTNSKQFHAFILEFFGRCSTSSWDFPSVIRTPIFRARGLMPAWVLKLCWRMKFKAIPSGIMQRESVTSLFSHELGQSES